jgi:hypothetical protein
MNLKSGIVNLAAIAAIILGVSVLSAYEAIVGPTGVLLYDKDKSYEGYTLFSPMGNKTTYLIDMEGCPEFYKVYKTEPKPALKKIALR